MRAIDTNVLVLLTRDDMPQTASAESFMLSLFRIKPSLGSRTA